MTNNSRIAEGFRGQHLVVLPADVRRMAEKHALLGGLMVTDAGVFPRASGHFVERMKGAATTLAICCLSGEGWVQVDGQKLAMPAGTLAWLPARRAHAYGAADGDSWTIEWAHFTGEEVDGWRELLKFPAEGGVITLGAAGAEALQLSRVWGALEQGYSLVNLVAASAALRAAFASIGERRTVGSAPRLAPERVMASAAWMKERLAQSIRLDELAKGAGMSVPHYCALFRQQTGFAPIDWLIRLRIQRACQLLDTTTENVAAIGLRVGFPDPYYFTRCFRRIMGMPPTTYRSVPKG